MTPAVQMVCVPHVMVKSPPTLKEVLVKVKALSNPSYICVHSSSIIISIYYSYTARILPNDKTPNQNCILITDKFFT